MTVIGKLQCEAYLIAGPSVCAWPGCAAPPSRHRPDKPVHDRAPGSLGLDPEADRVAAPALGLRRTMIMFAQVGKKHGHCPLFEEGLVYVGAPPNGRWRQLVADRCRVAIVDQWPLYRVGAVLAITRQADFAVVGEGTTAEDVERLARKRNPHVLLLEATCPTAWVQPRQSCECIRVSRYCSLRWWKTPEFAIGVIRAGAHGYITKGVTGQELVRSVATIHAGQRYIAPDLAWRLITKPASSPARRKVTDSSRLSPREQQVLNYSSQGLSNQEISHMLGLGLSTIKSCKTVAYRKIGVRNRVEAALAAADKSPSRTRQ